MTSNQTLSNWENVLFTRTMAVAAVSRRLLGHSTIMQINGESYRRKRARRLAT